MFSMLSNKSPPSSISGFGGSGFRAQLSWDWAPEAVIQVGLGLPSHQNLDWGRAHLRAPSGCCYTGLPIAAGLGSLLSALGSHRPPLGPGHEGPLHTPSHMWQLTSSRLAREGIEGSLLNGSLTGHNPLMAVTSVTSATFSWLEAVTGLTHTQVEGIMQGLVPEGEGGDH